MLPSKVRRVMSELGGAGFGVGEPSTLEAALERIVGAYQLLSHGPMCAARVPFGECTCLRAEIAELLDDYGIEV